MVICLLGIFAHVLRKSLKSEESTPHHPHLNLSSSDDEEFFRPRTKEQSPILPNEGFALLDQDSDSEEYIEMNHHRNRTKSVNSDDYYLKMILQYGSATLRIHRLLTRFTLLPRLTSFT